MKEIKAPRWSESVGYNHNGEGIIEKRVHFFARILLDAVCALIFMYSARIILKDVYAWGEFGDGNFIVLLIWAIVISFMMELSFSMSWKTRFLLQWGMLAAGVLYFVWYILKSDNSEHFFMGIEKVIGYYVEDINAYYNLNIISTTGRISYVTEVVDFIWIIALFVLFWLAKKLKNNLIVIVMPILIMVLELLVGFSPDEWGLVWMFVGALISNAGRWRNVDWARASSKGDFDNLSFFSWAGVGVCVLVICYVIRILGRSSAEELLWYSDDIKDVYAEIVEEIQEWSLWDEVDIGNSTNRDKLTNEPPDFDYVDVLYVETVTKPYGDMYLKGFYANVYDNGIWKQKDDDFESACKREGFDVEEVAEGIAHIGINNLEKKTYSSTLSQSAQEEYIYITYLEDSNKMYLPYFSRLDDYDNVKIENEGHIEKSGEIEEASINMWYFASEYKTRRFLFSTVGKEDWEEWYEEYVVENYVDVPEYMTNVRKVSDEINSWEMLQEIYNDSSNTENNIRLAKAEAVTKWMQLNTEYSTDLPELPNNADPIDFFLGTSKKGYCMHYASAATMILRDMGVPARYATGYLISNADFESGLTNYWATVQDSSSHSWVEIYLNGIGWVPIETTTGYSDTDITIGPEPVEPTTEPPTTNNTTGQSETRAPQEQTQEPTTKEKETKEEETTTKEKETKNDENVTIIGNENSKKHKDENLSKEEEKVKNTIKFIMALIIIAAIGIGVHFFLRDVRNKQLLNVIKQKNTLRAIKLMNRRVYKKLKLSAAMFKGDLSDMSYEETLMECYPDVPKEYWEKYMDIVKASAFSKRDFTVKEMEFCYYMYRIVMGDS